MAFKNAFYCDRHKAKVALSIVAWFCSKVVCSPVLQMLAGEATLTYWLVMGVLPK